MLAEGIWEIEQPRGGAVFARVLVIAPGPHGHLLRMDCGAAPGDNFGRATSDKVTARIAGATWTFSATDLGHRLVVTRTSRLFGLLPRRQSATYRRRQTP